MSAFKLSARASSSPVTAVAVSANNIVASGHQDGSIRLWDAGSGKELRVLQGHQDSVWSVAFSGDGARVASASSDKTVRLWDAGSGKELRVVQGHQASVMSVAFSEEGARVASGSYDKTVRLWDARSGKELRVLQGHQGFVTSVAFSGDEARVASGSDDNTIRIWDVAGGKLLATIVNAREGWAAFTPDGRYKVSGNIAGGFWYAINLCRFEPGELDPFLPPGTLRQLALDEPLW